MGGRGTACGAAARGAIVPDVVVVTATAIAMNDARSEPNIMRGIVNDTVSQ